ncbi:MAG TPA: pilus assembly protein PilM [Candidatus Hydrogenedentes bacterium]|mgnify:FL=1|nr:pilus assembly protein PilM [Candidatus Hydrogenedentota bacterium]HRT21170.1 pilus assembly protein PilM [Candidatus Hydrogenedentota bacterium]HRT65951.1 pilus assembly protein PilM [Candidatus Hydrogenedentota bacterium]
MALKAKIAAVEIAGDVVRVAVVRSGRRLPKVLALHEVRAEYTTPEERPEALQRAVAEAVRQVKGRPAAWVLCLSSFHAIVRTLTIPFRRARKVAAAVRFELEPYLAFPIEELSVDFLPVIEVDHQTDVLAVGVRRAVIEEQLALLQSAGIDPEGVDLDAIGLAGLWRAAHAPKKGLHALLHVGEDGAVLSILNNRALAYFRHLVTTPDRLPRETQNSIRAFLAGWRGGGEVASLTITGHVGEELQKAFADSFPIPVSHVNWMDSVKTFRAAQQTSGGGMHRWAGLIGVAQGAAGGGCSLNFRQNGLAYANRTKDLAPHVMALCCMVLLVLAGIAWHFYHGRFKSVEEASRLQAEIQTLESEVLALQGQGVNVPTEYFQAPILLDILQEIAAKLPNDKAAVTEIRIERPDAPNLPWIDIKGEVRDDAGFSAAVAALRQSSLFSIEEPELKLGEGRSTFRIVAKRKTS